MTRKLEELFELPPAEDTPEADAGIPAAQDLRTQLQNLDATIDKVDAALPGVRGLESSDQEMDGLAELAQDSYKDLMDLGMQVDSRFASEIFGVASNMLGHAITAKTAKLDKKLKMIDLQLKKMRLDQTAKPDGDDGSGLVQTAQGVVLSRNDLLERIVGRKDQNVQKE
jgi:hypothetical protein